MRFLKGPAKPRKPPKRKSSKGLAKQTAERLLAACSRIFNKPRKLTKCWRRLTESCASRKKRKVENNMADEIVKINITPEELNLIKNSVAKGATETELKLFLNDNLRRGIHPLDKLLHFSVRTDTQGQRSYTPITSIDFFRIRAER